MATEAALARRWERYGVKFIVDAPGSLPTDENIAHVLGRCVRPARPEEFGRIRLAVTRLRMLCRCEHWGVDHTESDGGACLEPGCGCARFAPGMAALATATLNLGRRTPRTPAEAEQAAAGIAQCEAEWRGDQEFTTSDGRTRAAVTAHWRAGYEIRHLELCKTLVTAADEADLVRWEGEGGAL